MDKVEEIRTAYKEGHKRMMGEGYKCSCDICYLLSVIDRQTPVVEAAKEWKAAKEYGVIWKIQRARLMLKKALSDMEGKEKP